MVFFMLVFVLLCILIPQARKQLSEGFKKSFEEARQKNNPYIEAHKTLIDQNEKNYQDYLEWCSKQNPVKIPMDKEVFFKNVDKQENYIKQLFD